MLGHVQQDAARRDRWDLVCAKPRQTVRGEEIFRFRAAIMHTVAPDMAKPVNLAADADMRNQPVIMAGNPVCALRFADSESLDSKAAARIGHAVRPGDNAQRIGLAFSDQSGRAGSHFRRDRGCHPQFRIGLANRQRCALTGIICRRTGRSDTGKCCQHEQTRIYSTHMKFPSHNRRSGLEYADPCARS